MKIFSIVWLVVVYLTLWLVIPKAAALFTLGSITAICLTYLTCEELLQ